MVNLRRMFSGRGGDPPALLAPLGLSVPSVIASLVTLTDGATVAVNAAQGGTFVLTCASNAAREVQVPTNGIAGQRIAVRVINTSGGALTLTTFAAAIRQPALTLPATGFERDYVLVFNGTSWCISGFAAADVPSTAAPPAPTFDFTGDWSYATGSTADALGNGPLGSRSFDQIGGSGASVIANPGTLGFPATLANVLRVNLLTANAGYTEPRRTSGIAVPAVGQTRYYRGYLQVTSAAGVAVTDPEMHPWQDGSSAGQLNFGIWIYQSTGGAGKWTMQWRPQASVNAFPNDRWQLSTPLDHDVTYRIEWYINRVGVGTFKAAIQVFNEAVSVTVPLFTSADFINQNATFDLATYVAANDFTFFNVNNMAGLNTGSNGLGGADWPNNMTYSYQGAMASGIDCGWPGPYILGNG